MTEKTSAESVRARPAGQSGVRSALDFVLILALAGTGAVVIYYAPKEAWVGLGLIVLAVTVYLARGRGLESFKAGKDGFEVVLKKAEEAQEAAIEARREAEEAKQDATDAKQIAAQQMQPSSLAPDPIGSEAARRTVSESTGWEHPNLQRGKKVKVDPQKDQWGGSAARNGRELSATVKPVGDGLFEVKLRLSPLEGAPDINHDVRFHLHETFPRAIRTVKPRNGEASLTLLAWGAFTVGAEVRYEEETFLELDLSDRSHGFPEQFRSR